jgi:hypothetical protein
MNNYARLMREGRQNLFLCCENSQVSKSSLLKPVYGLSKVQSTICSLDQNLYYLFEDRDHHILAMQAVPQPHVNWKRMLLDGRLHRRHIEQFARLLGTIHWRAYHWRSEVAPDFEDRSFFEHCTLGHTTAIARRRCLKLCTCSARPEV